MKKLFTVGLLALSLITGCSKGQTEDKKDSEDKVKIGIIQLTDHIALDRSREGFLDGLKEKGIDAEIDYQNAHGDHSQIPVLINKFKDSDVDFVYAITTPAAQGAKNIIKDRPIIFSAVANPVESGIVENVEEPEANITGVTDYISTEMMMDKALEIFPDIKTMGVIYSTNEKNSEFLVRDLKEVTRNRGIELVEVGVNNLSDITAAIANMRNKIDIFMGIQDSLISSSAKVISEEFTKANIPTISAEEGPVEQGLLVSNGVDFYELGKVASDQAKEIIDGKEVREIPVFYPTESAKVVNETTAKALHLEDNEKLFKDAKLVK